MSLTKTPATTEMPLPTSITLLTGFPIPMDNILQIFSHLSSTDIASLRGVCKALNQACLPTFCENIVATKKVYPTRTSLTGWLGLAANPAINLYIDKITVVGRTLLSAKYGYEWLLEEIQNDSTCVFEPHDFGTFQMFFAAHQTAAADTQRFVTSGRYRTELTALFRALTHVKKVNMQQKLQPGENVPWAGLALLPQLSGYRPDMDLRVLYGDWRYDVRHGRVTLWEDEYGEIQSAVPDVGEQAGFMEDCLAAFVAAGWMGKVVLA